jgi:hypothetical protein
MINTLSRQEDTMKKKTTLTAAEIKQGFHRLAAAPFMNVEFEQNQYQETLADKIDVLNFEFEVEPSLETIALPRFRDQEPHVIRGIIVNLAVSLVVSRLTPEETFNLGTSAEAIELFGRYYAGQEAAWKEKQAGWQKEDEEKALSGREPS